MTVKTKGGFYREMANSLRELGTGEAAALAADAMAETMLACHRKKLPREQWVMFELARMTCEVETSVALSLKAARGDGPERDLLMPCARLHSGSAAREVAVSGLRILRASGRYEESEIEAWKNEIGFDDLLATADGELEVMNQVAKALESQL
jgi:alkylation response protein AidB-like acyl-CoA dehydrogenase